MSTAVRCFEEEPARTKHQVVIWNAKLSAGNPRGAVKARTAP